MSLGQHINALFAVFGLSVHRTSSDAKKLNEGFDQHVEMAAAAGVDVNDYMETSLGWSPAKSFTSDYLLPHINSAAVVCELGPGTGRNTRHLIHRVSSLHVVDHSAWFCNFLRDYFRDAPNLHIHLNDGSNLPLDDRSCDLAFANGIFTHRTLGLMHNYAKEFYRVLKPGGYCVINFYDPTSERGWRRFVSTGDECTYHSKFVVERVFSEAGFSTITFDQPDHRTIMTARKPI